MKTLRFLTIATVLAALCSLSQAQLMNTGIGEGGQGGIPLANCGTGVISMAAGCTITVMLRLGP